jgi:hypothetical protein
MKILSLGAELFYSDGQTEITILIFVFRKFANAPKNKKKLIKTAQKVIAKFTVYDQSDFLGLSIYPGVSVNRKCNAYQ